jgi:hypothetical protein
MSIQAWSILMRQSHAHHVAAGRVQLAEKPEAPVPKWITGTPVARMRSISAREYGCTKRT